MPIEFAPEKKHRYLAKYYFAISDNPSDDVNPYLDFEIFLKSKVGSMNWGGGQNVRKRSKERFSYNYSRMLDGLGVKLDQWTVLEELENDDQTNDSAVSKWVGVAKFPLAHS